MKAPNWTSTFNFSSVEALNILAFSRESALGNTANKTEDLVGSIGFGIALCFRSKINAILKAGRSNSILEALLSPNIRLLFVVGQVD
ncbi:unnamed protein product [Dovyalis caffra]|uniref:Uncharacterized protein n=1 Tax=Dovyalis caffra TaxID=77055 RepID=A0AAV1RH13_9ROSI|nr:unnamed protein product [Dovyalis caffra]